MGGFELFERPDGARRPVPQRRRAHEQARREGTAGCYRAFVWICVDGRLNTVAIPLEAIDPLLPDAIRQRELADQLRTFDPWRDGGVGQSVSDEFEALLFDLERESGYEAVPIPDEVLADFRWDAIADVRSAEQQLSTVPFRWRLDMANIMEDMIDRDWADEAAH